jgi:HD-GYP domain-containing protein (c-di-GMP phosphodiesterase class II)
MLELVNINRLEPIVFIVKMTEQVAEGNINNLDEIDDVSLEVIQQHHERLDGSSYLDGLRGQQFSLYGKMAAIVDTYDSLITSRPYRKALKPADALKKIEDEELGLDKELVNKFIRYR